ncbi:hypothetical protein BDR04DRAFT_1022412, partial [Suillus decipiens]
SSWTANRKQFPLRPVYATTFNGSQGLTLEKAVLDLRADSFAHRLHCQECEAVETFKRFFEEMKR